MKALAPIVAVFSLVIGSLPLGCVGVGAPSNTSPGTITAVKPGTSPATLPTNDSTPMKINVVTTISVFEDMINEVGHDRVKVRSLIPAGVDPHTFQPTPQDVRDISGADIVIVNGLGLEGPLDSLIRNTIKPGTPLIVLSEGLPVLTDGQPGEQGDTQGGNPHLWLDVKNGVAYVQRINRGLAEIDAGGADTYQQNTDRYLSELADLHREIQRRIETIPPDNRKLVTFHDAFPYYARRYGLSLIGVVLVNPGSEPSAREVAALVDTIKRERVRTVFIEPQFNPRVMQVIAQEVGVEIAVLYSDSTGDGVTTYDSMMRYDTDQIVNGLR